MDNLYHQKTISANEVFDDRFVDTKTLYLYCFNILPSISFVSNLDGEKMFAVFKEKFAGQIQTTHQYRWYKHKKKRYQFDKTIIVLNNNCIVEFDNDYCEVLHDGHQHAFMEYVTALTKQFKERQKKQPQEINLIVQTGNSFCLKAMEIKRTKLDLALFYEDEFKEVDVIIRKRLTQKMIKE